MTDAEMQEIRTMLADLKQRLDQILGTLGEKKEFVKLEVFPNLQNLCHIKRIAEFGNVIDDRLKVSSDLEELPKSNKLS